MLTTRNCPLERINKPYFNFGLHRFLVLAGINEIFNIQSRFRIYRNANNLNYEHTFTPGNIDDFFVFFVLFFVLFFLVLLWFGCFCFVLLFCFFFVGVFSPFNLILSCLSNAYSTEQIHPLGVVCLWSLQQKLVNVFSFILILCFQNLSFSASC